MFALALLQAPLLVLLALYLNLLVALQALLLFATRAFLLADRALLVTLGLAALPVILALLLARVTLQFSPRLFLDLRPWRGDRTLVGAVAAPNDGPGRSRLGSGHRRQGGRWQCARARRP